MRVEDKGISRVVDREKEKQGYGLRLSEWVKDRGIMLVDFDLDVPAPTGCSEEQLRVELLDKIRDIGFGEEEVRLVEEAMEFAQESYKRAGIVKRGTGDEIMSHPLWMATLIAAKKYKDLELYLGIILHDIPEDTEVGLTEIGGVFGEEVANLVDGVTKVKSRLLTADELETEEGQIDYQQMKTLQKSKDKSKTIKKIFDGLMTDPRQMLIKGPDSAQNMLTLYGLKNPAKRREKANIALENWAPLMRMMGANDLAELIEVGAFMNTVEMTMSREEYWLLTDEQRMMPVTEVVARLELAMKMYGAVLDQEVNEWLKMGEFRGMQFEKMGVEWPNIYQVATRKLDGGVEAGVLPRINLVVEADEVEAWVKLFEEELAAENVGSPSNVEEIHPESVLYERKYLHVPLIVGEEEVGLEVLITSPEAILPVEVLYQADSSYEGKRVAWEKLELIKARYYQELRRGGGVVERFKGEASEVNRVLIYDMGGRPWHLEPGSTGLDFAYWIHSDVGREGVSLLIDIGGEKKEVGLGYVFCGGEVVEVVRVRGREASAGDYDWARRQKTRDQIKYQLIRRREKMDEELERLEHVASDINTVRVTRELEMVVWQIEEFNQEFVERGKKLLEWAGEQVFGERWSADYVENWIKHNDLSIQDLIKIGGIPKAVLVDGVRDEEELVRSTKIRKLLMFVEGLRQVNT